MLAQQSDMHPSRSQSGCQEREPQTVQNGALDDVHGPVFATDKVRVESLRESARIANFQLRDHLVTTSNLYMANCNCRSHRENVFRRNFATAKEATNNVCRLTSDPECSVCRIACRLVIDADSMYHHMSDIASSERCLRRSRIPHRHEGPCGWCIPCRTGGKCPYSESFDCYVTYDLSVYDETNDALVGTSKINGTRWLMNHVINSTNALDLFFCNAHTHVHEGPYAAGRESAMLPPSWICRLHNEICCSNATRLSDMTTSFVLTHVTPKEESSYPYTTHETTTTTIRTNASRKRKFITINKNRCEVLDPTYDPDTKRKRFSDKFYESKFNIKYFITVPMHLHHEQSSNYLSSLLKSAVLLEKLETVKNRYKRYISGGFLIPNVSRYKSGKDSVFRTDVTGFKTTALYQTSILSEELGVDEIVLPQNTYDEWQKTHDLRYVVIKRDPSITSRCAFVVRVKRNEDPSASVILLSALLAVLLNQDNDGDKNGVYAALLFLPKGWCTKYVTSYVLSMLKLSRAHRDRETFTGMPRHAFSEHDRVFMYRHRDSLKEKNPEFFGKYYDAYGPEGLCELGCSYMKSEFDAFRAALSELVKKHRYHIGIKDVLDTSRGGLFDVFRASESKNELVLKKFDDNLRKKLTLDDNSKDWTDTLNNYVLSEKRLKKQGRNVFINFYCGQDLIVLNDDLMHNKTRLADMRNYPNYVYRWPASVLSVYSNNILNSNK
ncbi:hypothetical protein QAD02_001422 [Eretmocerus hayati]|uniref:Uncharacterized protein n=1 Tax=Eretmocerus hayati TaxID=131215 RepID=A0ACC2NG67_9HYME|nr:hypothetical protein QAD02_001422 [Eretmocerus hayati]